MRKCSASFPRPTWPTSIRSGQRSTWCATPRCCSSTRCTAWTAASTPRPQMCEGSDVSADGLIWTFKLRSGLKFHDDEPVRPADVHRQPAALDGARQHGPDDQGPARRAWKPWTTAASACASTSRFRSCSMRLGKCGTPCAFIMPERIAKTDPFKQISEYVGSGPFKFQTRRMGARRFRRVRAL